MSASNHDLAGPDDDGLAACVDWAPLPAPRPGLRAVVVVPMRNEAALLDDTLSALAAQRGVASVLFEVLVLANNCSDATAAQARAFALRCTAVPVHVVDATLPAPFANVGSARRALMDEAVRRLDAAGGAAGAILSTDGDTRVEPHWVAASLAALDAGADAVGGRILTDLHPTWPAGLARAQRLDTAYLLLRSRLESLADPDAGDPWPRHHQHFAASLAITRSAYRRVGGLPRVPFLEDMALVRALRRDDRAVRHAPEVRVRTSGRLDGRAEVGLSWQLREWIGRAEQLAAPRVVDPRIELRTWCLRRTARTLWAARARGRGHGAAVRRLAGELGVEPAWTEKHLHGAATFGRFWAEIDDPTATTANDDPGAAGLPLDEALSLLRRLVRERANAAPPR